MGGRLGVRWPRLFVICAFGNLVALWHYAQLKQHRMGGVEASETF